MDEESLVLIEDIESTLCAEVKLRDETVQRLAMALVARYNIGLRENTVETTPRPRMTKAAAVAPERKHKTAPPSIMAQAENQADPNIITAEKLQTISDAEREQMLADAAAERYNLVEGVSVPSGGGEGGFVDADPNGNITAAALFGEGDPDNILERERQMRLRKQKSVLEGGGGGSFRRSG
jgi:hypothetical protein